MEDYRKLYSNCRLCPRKCGVDRRAGETGFCGESGVMRVAWAGLHKGEEPPVTGEKGSGTIFFTGCTLRCAFCQNRQLSRGEAGRAASPEELAAIMLTLRDQGAENINFVTGTHFIPGILEALALAVSRGMSLPVVWNSSGFESPGSLSLLEKHVTLWLPDLKTLDPDLAGALFQAPGYGDFAGAAVRTMARFSRESRKGIPFEGQTRGLIVRHLILPGEMDSTRRVLKWFARLNTEFPGTLLSLMTQYTPVRGAGAAAPDRPLSNKEAYDVYDVLEDLRIEDGFFQGPPEEAEGEWEPDFNRENPFPDGWARKLWHWREND